MERMEVDTDVCMEPIQKLMPSSDSTKFSQLWHQIRCTMQCVLMAQPIPRSAWIERFSDVYAIINGLPSEYTNQLYEQVRDLYQNWVRRVYEQLSVTPAEHFLTSYLDKWTVFEHGADLNNKLLMHLNEIHKKFAKAINCNEFPAVHLGFTLPETGDEYLECSDLALRSWNDGVIRGLRSQINACLMRAVDEDRRRGGATDPVSSKTLKEVIMSLVAVDKHRHRRQLETYRSVFEDSFITMTGEYYRNEAAAYVHHMNSIAYIKLVLTREEEECTRANRLCHESSVAKVKHTIQEKMVEEHLDIILRDSRVIIDENRLGDLRNLYRILQSSHIGIKLLRDNFMAFVEEKARETVGSNAAERQPADLVENIDGVLKRFDDIVRDVFLEDKSFKKAVDDAIKIVVNQQSATAGTNFASAELVAKYCDSILRKNRFGTEAEEKLNGAIRIFRFLDDKDVFQRYYALMMGKRLINKLSSLEMELKVVNNLRDACGCDFTGKLSRMLRDVNSSEFLCSEFCKTSVARCSFEFQINCLTKGVWPVPNHEISFKLPAILQPVRDEFTQFHTLRKPGTRLSWIHQFETVDVKLNFCKRPTLATMTVPQLAVCLCFEDVDMLTFQSIKEATGLPDDHLDLCLKGLSEAGVLSRGTLLRSFNLNVDWAPMKKRIKISAPKEARDLPAQEQVATEKSAGDTRNVFLQATICRIMKSRQVASQAQLIEAIREAAKDRFVPTPVMISKAIDTLLEKEYIKRSLTAQDVYEYMA